MNAEDYITEEPILTTFDDLYLDYDNNDDDQQNENNNNNNNNNTGTTSLTADELFKHISNAFAATASNNNNNNNNNNPDTHSNDNNTEDDAPQTATMMTKHDLKRTVEQATQVALDEQYFDDVLDTLARRRRQLVVSGTTVRLARRNREDENENENNNTNEQQGEINNANEDDGGGDSGGQKLRFIVVNNKRDGGMIFCTEGRNTRFAAQYVGLPPIDTYFIIEHRSQEQLEQAASGGFVRSHRYECRRVRASGYITFHQQNKDDDDSAAGGGGGCGEVSGENKTYTLSQLQTTPEWPEAAIDELLREKGPSTEWFVSNSVAGTGKAFVASKLVPEQERRATTMCRELCQDMGLPLARVQCYSQFDANCVRFYFVPDKQNWTGSYFEHLAKRFEDLAKALHESLNTPLTKSIYRLQDRSTTIKFLREADVVDDSSSKLALLQNNESIDDQQQQVAILEESQEYAFTDNNTQAQQDASKFGGGRFVKNAPSFSATTAAAASARGGGGGGVTVPMSERTGEEVPENAPKKHFVIVYFGPFAIERFWAPEPVSPGEHVICFRKVISHMGNNQHDCEKFDDIGRVLASGTCDAESEAIVEMEQERSEVKLIREVNARADRSHGGFATEDEVDALYDATQGFNKTAVGIVEDTINYCRENVRGRDRGGSSAPEVAVRDARFTLDKTNLNVYLKALVPRAQNVSSVRILGKILSDLSHKIRDLCLPKVHIECFSIDALPKISLKFAKNFERIQPPPLPETTKEEQGQQPSSSNYANNPRTGSEMNLSSTTVQHHHHQHQHHPDDIYDGSAEVMTSETSRSITPNPPPPPHPHHPVAPLSSSSRGPSDDLFRTLLMQQQQAAAPPAQQPPTAPKVVQLRHNPLRTPPPLLVVNGTPRLRRLAQLPSGIAFPPPISPMFMRAQQGQHHHHQHQHPHDPTREESTRVLTLGGPRHHQRTNSNRGGGAQYQDKGSDDVSDDDPHFS